MTLYKIRNQLTGKFGGPGGKNGKTWNSLKDILGHFSLFLNYTCLKPVYIHPYFPYTANDLVYAITIDFQEEEVYLDEPLPVIEFILKYAGIKSMCYKAAKKYEEALNG